MRLLRRLLAVRRHRQEIQRLKGLYERFAHIGDTGPALLERMEREADAHDRVRPWFISRAPRYEAAVQDDGEHDSCSISQSR